MLLYCSMVISFWARVSAHAFYLVWKSNISFQFHLSTRKQINKWIIIAVINLLRMDWIEILFRRNLQVTCTFIMKTNIKCKFLLITLDYSENWYSDLSFMIYSISHFWEKSFQIQQVYRISVMAHCSLKQTNYLTLIVSLELHICFVSFVWHLNRGVAIKERRVCSCVITNNIICIVNEFT